MATATAIPMSIPILDLKAHYVTIREEIKSAINGVIERQHFILGPEVKMLEQEVAVCCSRRFAVGVASDTEALQLALRACDVGPGDEVIMPSFASMATANCVSLLGAVPVLAEIDPDSFNLDPEDLTNRITHRTKTIIPVHMYGLSADMDPLLNVAQRYGLRVIEDCTQAIGATYRDLPVGSMSDIGCLSFLPTKNLGGYRDGGMIVTDSEDIHRLLISLPVHGSDKTCFSEEGSWNSRLDELQAAILRVRLRYLRKWSSLRRAAAERYDRLLANAPGISVPARNSSAGHAYHRYTIRVQKRDLVQKSLADQGVSAMVYYRVPIHRQATYAGLGYREGDFPITEAACREVLSLPIFPELTDAQAEYVVRSLRVALNGLELL